MAPEHRTPDGAWAVAHKLLHKAAMRLSMEHFYTAAMGVTIRYALTREQASAMKKTKKHFSGLTHSGWGMEARFAPCQDTLTLLNVLRDAWAKRPEGPEFARPFFVGVTMHHLIPESDLQASLFADARQPRRTRRHHGQAEPEVRPHHPALRRHAPREGVRAHPHRLHPNPRPVRRGLHVTTEVSFSFWLLAKG